MNQSISHPVEDSVLEIISKHGLIPVAVVDDAQNASPLADALISAKLNLCEISFRTACAAEVMLEISAKYPNIILGAGSVNTVKDAAKAVDAGAKFIVCPSLIVDIADYCRERGVLVIPCCVTASDVQQALSHGLTTLKFSPAGPSGGLDTINYLASSFESVRFIVAGGLDAENVNSYANNPAVTACACSWMVDRELIKANKFDDIRARVRDTIFSILNFRFAHFGINCDTAEEGYNNIFRLADMFDLRLGDTESSTYVGKEVEITKVPFKVRGPHGHIGYHTDSLARSMFYLEKMGVEFNQDSLKNYNDKAYVVYLKDDLAGFAIHIEERNNHNPPSWAHRDEIRKKVGRNS